MKEDILKYFADTFGLEGGEASDLFVSYADTVAENLAKIKSAETAADIEIIRQSAHSIKGCALNCGQIEMSEAARTVEYAAKAFDKTAIADGMVNLERLAAELAAER